MQKQTILYYIDQLVTRSVYIYTAIVYTNMVGNGLRSVEFRVIALFNHIFVCLMRFISRPSASH